MNIKILKTQMKLYTTAEYDTNENRFRLKLKQIIKLNSLVQNYFETFLSYEEQEQCDEIIEKMTYALLDEVIVELKATKDEQEANEILWYLLTLGSN